MAKSELDWTIECHDNPMFAAEHIVKLEAENKRLREVLQSIASNTCCEPCQEAKLVAQAALLEGEGDA